MKTQIQSSLTLLALLSSLRTLTQAAPLGKAFTYQGKLSTGTNAANGSYDLKFSLYDALSSGGQVGSSRTNAATFVTNGHYPETLTITKAMTLESWGDGPVVIGP